MGHSTPSRVAAFHYSWFHNTMGSHSIPCTPSSQLDVLLHGHWHLSYEVGWLAWDIRRYEGMQAILIALLHARDFKHIQSRNFTTRWAIITSIESQLKVKWPQTKHIEVTSIYGHNEWTLHTDTQPGLMGKIWSQCTKGCGEKVEGAAIIMICPKQRMTGDTAMLVLL